MCFLMVGGFCWGIDSTNRSKQVVSFSHSGSFVVLRDV